MLNKWHKNKTSKDVLIVFLFLGSSVFAASYSFSGTMKLRMLDGSENGVYYSIGSNKNISISGKVKCIGYNAKEVEKDIRGNKVGVQTTYIQLYEINNSGIGTPLCGSSVKVSSSSGSMSFSSTGRSKYSKKKYMYIYKPMNDGYDLAISGSITY